MLTEPFVSRLLEDPSDDHRCLGAHDCRASLVEVEGVLVEVGMLCHQLVLVIDGNPLRFDEGLSDGISRVNAGIRGAIGCLGFDRRDRSPDEFAVTWECPNGLEKNGKAGLELCFRIAPAVQAIVEVNYREGDTLQGGELCNLAGKASIAHGCRRRQEVDISDAAEIFGYLWEIVAHDRVAEKKDIGQLGVGELRTNFPGPLVLLRNRSLVLGAKE